MMEVDAAEASGLALTTVNIVTAMHRLAKCAAAGSTLQQHDAMLMLQRVEHELAQASAAVALDDRALTTLAWSLGSLYQTLSGARVHCKPRVESVELAEQVRKSLGQIVLLLESRPLSLIPAQGLSNVAWSCAKCNIQGEATGQLLDRIAEVLQVGRAEQTWNAQDLSNLAWAYGRLRTRTSLRPQDRAALGTISRAALNLGLHRFRPQGLTNLLWALAHLNVSCAELSEAICQVYIYIFIYIYIVYLYVYVYICICIYMYVFVYMNRAIRKRNTDGVERKSRYTRRSEPTSLQ